MKSILLVDDNESFRRPLATVLQHAGYKVECAGDGSRALEIFRRTEFDLVITDLIMPEKEGLETIAELRRINPAIRIIAISGGGRVDAGDFLVVARRMGANATLAKPFRSQAILDLIDEVTGGKSASAAED